MPSWDTSDELRYIADIGKASGLLGNTYTRVELLERYLDGALKRERWGEVDGPRVLQVVVRQIERERGHEATN